jgi:DNA invertase Pin-like site-specific DNA recombinase
MMMQMVGAFAEFERAMLRERTKAGLDSARREGRIGGRQPKLSPQQQSEIRRMVSRGNKTAADACTAIPRNQGLFQGRGPPTLVADQA